MLKNIASIHQEDLSITLEGSRKRLNDLLKGSYGVDFVEVTLADGKVRFNVYVDSHAYYCGKLKNFLRR